MVLLKKVVLALMLVLVSAGIAQAAISNVTVSSPAVDLWTSDLNFTVNFTATSDTDAQFECFLYLDATLFGTNGAVDNNTLSSILSDNVTDEGTFDFYVECADSEGNMSSSAQNISFDRTLPIANVVTPANLNETTDLTPQVVFYATDAMADIMSYEAYVNGETENQSGTIGNSSGSTTVSFNMSTRTPGNHTFVIQVTDYAGNSQNSTLRTITVVAYPTTAPVLQQSGVSNLNDNGIIRLNWTADVNAESYRVYRSNAEITDATALTQLAEVTAIEYNDTNVSHGETYWYAITTVNIVDLENKSVVSDSFNVTVNDSVLPRVTAEVSATSNANGTITLNWTAVTLDIDGNSEGSGITYRVFRTLNVSGLNTSSTSERLAVVSSTTYTDATLTTGNNYTYVITTLDDASNHNGSVLAQNQVELEAEACSTTWSEWSACSSSEQTRTRVCIGGGEDSQTQSCSVSSGGGGGGSSSGPPGIARAAQVSQGNVNQSRAGTWYWTGIRPNEQNVLNVSNQNMSIKEIRVNAKKNINNLEVRMGEFATGIEPSSVKPRGQVYKYLEITANQNINDDVNSLVFEFTVPLDWISFQGATAQDVKLFRFVNNNWVQLQTRYLRSVGGNAVYEATTPGLSYFAITTGIDTLSTTTPETPIVQEPVVEEVVPVTAPTTPTQVPEEQNERGRGAGLMAFFSIFVILIVVVVGALFFMNKRHQEERLREMDSSSKTEEVKVISPKTKSTRTKK